MSALNKQFAELTEAHAEFIEIANQLDPEKRFQPGVCGEWSPKDVVAHLVGWDALLLAFIIDADNFTPPDDIDQFNQQSVANCTHLGWPEVLQEMADTFYHLQRAMGTVTPERSTHDRVLSWLAGRTEDYALHQTHIADWVP